MSWSTLSLLLWVVVSTVAYMCMYLRRQHKCTSRDTDAAVKGTPASLIAISKRICGVLRTRRAIATSCTRAAERPRPTACFLVLSSVVFEREHGKFDGRHEIRRVPAARSLLLQSSRVWSCAR
jgi:hypothetical protein